jgi:hypothetical protein
MARLVHVLECCAAATPRAASRLPTHLVLTLAVAPIETGTHILCDGVRCCRNSAARALAVKVLSV